MPARKNRTPEENRDHRLELADRLIAMMEKGEAHWQKPWEAGAIQPPTNAVTGKPYRGVNSEYLFAFSPDPTDNRWCTYRQAQEQGWQVRKGEHALAFIEKYTPYERKPTEEERQNRIAEGRDPDAPVQAVSIRHYPVFHASQIDGIPPLERAPKPEIEGKPDPRIDKLAEAMGVQVTRGGGRAFYRSLTDTVNLPPVESFHTATGHDTTFLHELSHATGHESRLNRELGNPFGSEKYALEELRAEMSAAMTAAALGIGFDPASQELEEGRETVNSAAYLAGWLKALPDKDRKKILMQTIRDSQDISDYLLMRTPELEIAAPGVEVDNRTPGKSQAEERALQANGLTPATLDPELVAHLEERNRIRQGERVSAPAVGDDWPGGLPTGLGGDAVANAEAFIQLSAMRDPERAERWAEALRSDPHGYADAVGLEGDNIIGIATQMEQGLKRMRSPQVGDLVRFEPHVKDPLHGEPFSGRVIAALDTSGGDIRYHLRAEIGPDKGMEGTVYGKNGSFRLVGIEQAHGFDRNAPERLSPEQKAIEEYKAFYDQMPERAGKLMAEARERAARLAPADFRGFSDLARDFNKGVDDVFGIIREGENRGASAPELHLAQALSRGSITDLPVVKSARAQSRAIGDRFHDLNMELREGFRERLREYGKALLRAGTLHEPREIVQAVYWKHGIEAGPDSPMVDKLVTAVQEKDLKTLTGWIGHNSQNPATEEAFTLLTQVPLGRTQKERVAQLEAWAGPERVEALHKAREEAERSRAEEAPRKAVRQTFDALTAINVRLSEKSAETLDGQEWIAAKVAEGYTTVGNHQKGAVTLRHLENPKTRQTVWLKDSRFQSYCRAIQALEPSGDIAKAMEAAKIPLAERPKAVEPAHAPGKAPEPKALNPFEEKQKARQDRYRALAEKTRAKALARLDQARRMAEIIPFGQPILVGHHSEHRDRRYRARIHDTFGKGFTLLDKADYYQARAERISNAISADDPEAVRKLKEKLEGLKKSQEMMKAANAVIRKFQTPEERKAGLERIGFSRSQAEKVLAPDFAGRVGFPPYALSNNQANIRRIEERIKGLEKAASLEDRTTEFAWGKVRENKAINRIQFLFEEKPDNAVRDLMKKSGFRWAPSEGAWQRQWTGNAVRAAQQAIQQLDEWYPASRDREVPQPSTAPESGLHAKHPEPGKAPDPAPTAVIRGRDGTRYALSLREKDGEVLAKLEIAGGETVEGVLQPFLSAKIPDVPKLGARMELPDGRTFAVRLSPGNGGVEADLLCSAPAPEWQSFTWRRLNDVPGKLRADGVNSPEAKWVAERLGVDARGMQLQELATGVGAYRAPEKTREQAKGMDR
jgi:antirestriction protein ArdC